jgi:hypothetical protein
MTSLLFAQPIILPLVSVPSDAKARPTEVHAANLLLSHIPILLSPMILPNIVPTFQPHQPPKLLLTRNKRPKPINLKEPRNIRPHREEGTFGNGGEVSQPRVERPQFRNGLSR